MKGRSDFERVLEQYLQKGGAVLFELPEEGYLEGNIASLDALTRKGFSGLYISLERPFSEVQSRLKRKGVDMGRVLFVDAFMQEHGSDTENGCVHIPATIAIDELVRAINRSLPKLKSRRRFILIDSGPALSLGKPLSEIERFWEFLARTMRKREFEDMLVVLNVPEGVERQSFRFESAFRFYI